MFKFIKQVFIPLSFNGSLSPVAKGSVQTKCIPLNNEPCLARPTLIHLNSNELSYYPFKVNLDRCYKQMFNAFLFNIRNYSPKERNIQRREVELNITLPKVKNVDIKQKMAWNTRKRVREC